MILVTGATGNVGGEVVRRLLDQGVAVRAAVQDIAAARRQLGDHIGYAPLDFTNPSTYGDALDGVSKIFLMRPPALADTNRYINPFVDAAKARGVEQMVFLSLLGAEKNPLVPHRAVETHLQQVDVPWTLLRAGFFMQNLSTTHRADVQDDDDIFVPAGRGKTSFIDVRDIAAVAVKALTEPNHTCKAYPLTGGEALDYYEVAAIFSDVLRRPIIYRNPSITAFVRRMRQRGFGAGFILVTLGIYTTARLGLAGTVTPHTATLLGRPPISMRQFVEDYRTCWAKSV